ncbi:MAG TPA: GNAT family N-acetyltransferase [Chthoniobacteraceae bacterium]|jgi:ribosomal protein S18 acetylase RimI-like enzyme
MSLRFQLLTRERLLETLGLVEEFYREERLPFDLPIISRSLQELLAAPESGRLWLLESDEQTIGYFLLTSGFILEFGGRQYFLDEFYVQPHLRGRGLGTLAIGFIEGLCRAEGVHVLRLEVESANSRSIALYERLGFRRHERHTMTRILRGLGE